MVFDATFNNISVTVKKLTQLFLYNDKRLYRVRVRIIVPNFTFDNTSVISWRSVLLVEETGVYGEKHRPATSH